MKSWIVIISCFFIIAFKLPLSAQPGKDRKALKKQEKADIDSLFLVQSLPINVLHTTINPTPGITDSLIALLKRKKYNYIDSLAYAQLFKAKLSELMPAAGDLQGMREFIANTQSDKNYYANKIESADPFAQRIQISFVKKESGINYINVRRSNAPNSKKYRDWNFTYTDSEPPDQIASRILNSLISKYES